jgi:hypothetical protein
VKNALPVSIKSIESIFLPDVIFRSSWGVYESQNAALAIAANKPTKESAK